MFQIKNMIKNILNQTVRNPKINHIRAYKLKNVFDNFTKQGTMLRTKKKQINNATTFCQFPWPKSMAKIREKYKKSYNVSNKQNM
jgi:hypothetical protein